MDKFLNMVAGLLLSRYESMVNDSVTLLPRCVGGSLLARFLDSLFSLRLSGLRAALCVLLLVGATEGWAAEDADKAKKTAKNSVVRSDKELSSSNVVPSFFPDEEGPAPYKLCRPYYDGYRIYHDYYVKYAGPALGVSFQTFFNKEYATATYSDFKRLLAMGSVRDGINIVDKKSEIAAYDFYLEKIAMNIIIYNEYKNDYEKIIKYIFEKNKKLKSEIISIKIEMIKNRNLYTNEYEYFNFIKSNKIDIIINDNCSSVFTSMIANSVYFKNTLNKMTKFSWFPKLNYQYIFAVNRMILAKEQLNSMSQLKELVNVK